MTAVTPSIKSETLTTKDGYKFAEELWTPDDAKKLIEQTDGTLNRNTRVRLVTNYRRDMEQGRWGWSDVPIVITPEGDVIQGKHRLSALADAKIDGVWFFVMRDVPAHTIHNFDTGAKRTAADQLKLQGVADYARAASVASVWYRYTHSDPKFRRWEGNLRPTTSEVVQTYWDNEDRINRSTHGTRLSALRNTDATPAIMSLAWMLFEEQDAQSCAEFFTVLANRELRHQPENKVIDLLYVALHGEVKRSRSSVAEVNPRTALALIIKAWNKWVSGAGSANTSLKFQARVEAFPRVLKP